MGNGHHQGIETLSLVEFHGEDITFENGEFDRYVERLPPELAVDLSEGAFVPGVRILLDAVT